MKREGCVFPPLQREIKGLPPRHEGVKVYRHLLLVLTVIALAVFAGVDSGRAATALDATKGLCLECHSKAAHLIGKPVVHRPVRDGKCTACHNPHASRHSGLLADSGSALCFNCHDRRKGFDARVVHKPVEEGKCLSCHDAHASVNAFLLEEPGGKSCFSCHPQEGLMAGKNVHPEVKKGNCRVCHSPHAAAFDGLLVKKRKALCAGCHYPENGRRAAKPCVYKVVGSDCTGCHSPHSSDRKGLLKAELHSPFEAKKCEKCHKGGAPYSGNTGGVGRCLECHDKTMASFNKINSHLIAGVQNSCTNCHNPHASDEKNLFRHKAEKVCFGCHSDSKEFVAKSSHTHPGIDRCSDCHVSHGSNNRFFLSGGGETCLSEACHLTQGSFSHPVGDKVIDPRSNSPMDCSTCHNPMGSPEEFILRFKKDRELCVQCHPG